MTIRSGAGRCPHPSCTRACHPPAGPAVPLAEHLPNATLVICLDALIGPVAFRRIGHATTPSWPARTKDRQTADGKGRTDDPIHTQCRTVDGVSILSRRVNCTRRARDVFVPVARDPVRLTP